MTAAVKAALRRRDTVVLLAALALLVAWELGGWDLALTRRFGSAEGFAWRNAWWAQQLLHDGGRLLAWGLLGMAVLGLWRPWLTGPTRRQRVFWLGVLLTSVVLVPAIKRLSSTSCPWELAEFGGHAAYVPHWLLGVADGGSGHCFPSGHAVSAFAFVALFFLWRPHRPRLAWALLGAVLAFGAVSGLTQLVRGAHFLSHSLWSAWLCAAIAVAARPLAPVAELGPVDAQPAWDDRSGAASGDGQALGGVSQVADQRR